MHFAEVARRREPQLGSSGVSDQDQTTAYCFSCWLSDILDFQDGTSMAVRAFRGPDAVLLNSPVSCRLAFMDD